MPMPFACCGGLDPDAARAKAQSEAIDRRLKSDGREVEREIKLLLLGAGESGKSTIVKQMRIINGEGFTAKDRAEFQGVIMDNVLKSMQTLCQGLDTMRISLGDEGNSSNANLLKSYDGHVSRNDFCQTYASAVKALWKDSGIQEVFKRRNELQLHDSAPYYFARLDTISAESYVPDQEDVLRSRVATTGIVEYKFRIEHCWFRMMDVGGQRSERRKWIHCFDGVTSIIFVVGISAYDQMLYEDANTNRMQESLTLFETIVNYKWFEKASMLLFLNKCDLLEEKIATSPISKYFPQYTGPTDNVEAVKEFILQMFLSKNRDENKQIYYHYTTATNTENIKAIWSTVKETILHNNLMSVGLI